MPTSLQRASYIARLTASSFLRRLRFAMGRIESDTGSTTNSLSIDAAVAYIHRTFQDYERYGQLDAGAIAGARLLEIGPGDSLGVGLRFLARGAASYTTLDKFFSQRDTENERRIYERLREDLPPDEQQRFDAAVTLATPPSFAPDKVHAVYGRGAQEADQVFAPASFDGILSRAVLHEIYEARAALEALDRVLKPGGWMLHKIDLRDDGLFSGRGFHPLEFLTISNPVYWLMAYDTDKTCRRPLPFYREILQQLGYEARFIVTGIIETEGYQAVENPSGDGKEKLEAGVDFGPEQQRLLAAIRPRLSADFRNLDDSDLLAASVFLVARKPK
jgi:SAM-dependent methyltransferase